MAAKFTIKPADIPKETLKIVEDSKTIITNLQEQLLVLAETQKKSFKKLIPRLDSLEQISKEVRIDYKGRDIPQGNSFNDILTKTSRALMDSIPKQFLERPSESSSDLGTKFLLRFNKNPLLGMKFLSRWLNPFIKQTLKATDFHGILKTTNLSKYLIETLKLDELRSPDDISKPSIFKRLGDKFMSIFHRGKLFDRIITTGKAALVKSIPSLLKVVSSAMIKGIEATFKGFNIFISFIKALISPAGIMLMAILAPFIKAKIIDPVIKFIEPYLPLIKETYDFMKPILSEAKDKLLSLYSFMTETAFPKFKDGLSDLSAWAGKMSVEFPTYIENIKNWFSTNVIGSLKEMRNKIFSIPDMIQRFGYDLLHPGGSTRAEDIKNELDRTYNNLELMDLLSRKETRNKDLIQELLEDRKKLELNLIDKSKGFSQQLAAMQKIQSEFSGLTEYSPLSQKEFDKSTEELKKLMVNFPKANLRTQTELTKNGPDISKVLENISEDQVTKENLEDQIDPLSNGINTVQKQNEESHKDLKDIKDILLKKTDTKNPGYFNYQSVVSQPSSNPNSPNIYANP